MSVSELIKKLNQNKFFKFVSSIRLAVPLMLFLGACVAYGTIIESNYNSEYASMAIYKSTWFGFLLILLWLNIFCATISRIPFKKHHTGFVITHIGLLTLLIGGFVTNRYGIDGQLAIVEGQSGSTVVLPSLMIGYQFEGSPSAQTIKFNKTISEQNQSDLKSINEELGHLFEVKSYIPFAQIEKDFVEDATIPDQVKEVALSFILKSKFFNVNEWLHSQNNPEMKMGPATLKLVKVSNIDEIPFKPTKPSSKKSAPQIKSKSTPANREVNSVKESTTSQATSEQILTLTNLKNPSDTKKIKVKDLIKKPLQINNLKIQIVKLYKNAVVAQNKMAENDDGSNANPAIELSVEKDGQKLREVLYAKFAGFSLNKDGVFGYKLSFESPNIAAVPTSPHGGGGGGHANMSADSESQTEQPVAQENSMQNAAMAAMSGGNTVIFSVDPKIKGKARVTLVKGGQLVMSEILTEGQNIQTPWMGMQIFLGSIKIGANERIIAKPINPIKAKQLPGSAILISTTTNSAEDFWLAEGDQKEISLASKKAVAYFGRQTIDLPFELKLEKFTKVDYPGTATPMSFESLVQVGKTGIVQKISMNEPLKLDGFTVYQASYSMEPNSPVMSIFSVNQDPGRSLKYFGSLIMGLGIIIITLMRSRVWKKLSSSKA